MEQTPEERRFERIEAAHETLAKAVASLATDSHSAFSNMNATQRFLIDENIRMLTRIDKRDNDVSALALAAKALIDVQTMQGKNLQSVIDLTGTLIAAQAKSDLAQAETQGKLDALIDMWDRSIRERGAKNGSPQPPPAA